MGYGGDPHVVLCSVGMRRAQSFATTFARGTVNGDPGPWGVSYLQCNGQRPQVCSIFQEGVGAIEGGSTR